MSNFGTFASKHNFAVDLRRVEKTPEKKTFSDETWARIEAQMAQIRGQAIPKEAVQWLDLPIPRSPYPQRNLTDEAWNKARAALGSSKPSDEPLHATTLPTVVDMGLIEVF